MADNLNDSVLDLEVRDERLASAADRLRLEDAVSQLVVPDAAAAVIGPESANVFPAPVPGRVLRIATQLGNEATAKSRVIFDNDTHDVVVVVVVELDSPNEVQERHRTPPSCAGSQK